MLVGWASRWVVVGWVPNLEGDHVLGQLLWCWLLLGTVMVWLGARYLDSLDAWPVDALLDTLIHCYVPFPFWPPSPPPQDVT